MSDITFVLTDPDGTQVRVPAHKLVLAISSPVFEAMFYGELAEKTREIELPDTERPFLLEFLRFLYCDKVELTTDNAFGVLYLAQKYILPLLAGKCWAFIDENTCACLESDNSVSTFNSEMLTCLAKRDTLQINNELELFEALKYLAEKSCMAEGMEPTGWAVRSALGDVMTLFRWPAMSVRDFAQRVVPTGILTDKESLDVYEYYSGAKTGRKRKFCEIYRPGSVPGAVLHECCREFKTTGLMDLIGVKEIKEHLDFVTETRNLHLKGFHLIIRSLTQHSTPKKALLHAVLVEQDGQERVATVGPRTVKMLDLRYGYIAISVQLENPVLIWKGLTYSLKMKLRTLPGETMTMKDFRGFAESATGSDVHFRFGGNSKHIYKLLFYKLD